MAMTPGLSPLGAIAAQLFSNSLIAAIQIIRQTAWLLISGTSGKNAVAP
jgi:hypothetical protein